MDEKESKYTIYILSILVVILILIAIPNEYEYQNNIDIQPQQLKTVERFEIIQIDGRIIYYKDNENHINTIRSPNVFIVFSNETYLEKIKYGGLLDFYKYTLYINTTEYQ